ncbi:MAG: hypothetical protein UZ11_BCD004001029 [Bacteroidetes bacterium OLB11]|nr:MAG: hypothetical protein UZ11_BCD004001029 [Bacteroidetes bacterium OLB11]
MLVVNTFLDEIEYTNIKFEIEVNNSNKRMNNLQKSIIVQYKDSM